MNYITKLGKVLDKIVTYAFGDSASCLNTASTQSFQTSALTIAANGYLTNQTLQCTIAPYRNQSLWPFAIAGYSISGSNRTTMVLTQCYLSNRSTNSATVNFEVRNNSSSKVTDLKITFHIFSIGSKSFTPIQ